MRGGAGPPGRGARAPSAVAVGGCEAAAAVGGCEASPRLRPLPRFCLASAQGPKAFGDRAARSLWSCVTGRSLVLFSLSVR